MTNLAKNFDNEIFEEFLEDKPNHGFKLLHFNDDFLLRHLELSERLNLLSEKCILFNIDIFKELSTTLNFIENNLLSIELAPEDYNNQFIKNIIKGLNLVEKELNHIESICIV